MRSPHNVLESLKSKATDANYHYQRLYRNLYNPEFYLLAYQRIQAKQGNMTAGADGKTIDGMGMKRIESLILKLRDFSYQPKPARRTYIPKANGKMRPLGIPSFDDKLVQEVVRLILESIYEPTFCDTSHGFRPKRSCHTALQYVKRNYTGVKWFVEGDIKGCFDNVDHHVLIQILRRRIKDEHFIGLIWKFLKAGYMEDWVYHNTYSGTPQGSLISPILANIYLNELDLFMADYAKSFNRGSKRRINPAYKKPLDVRRGKQEWLKRNEHRINEEQRKEVLTQIKKINQYLKTIPYGDPMDEEYKRIVYVRYADDFLIGVIGSKADAERKYGKNQCDRKSGTGIDPQNMRRRQRIGQDRLDYHAGRGKRCACDHSGTDSGNPCIQDNIVDIRLFTGSTQGSEHFSRRDRDCTDTQGQDQDQDSRGCQPETEQVGPFSLFHKGSPPDSDTLLPIVHRVSDYRGLHPSDKCVLLSPH